MRLIDLDKVRIYVQVPRGRKIVQEVIDKLNEKLDELPIVDAVPVVRCKDCKYAQKEFFSKTLSCKVWGDKFSPEDFCSTGKRRDEDDH